MKIKHDQSDAIPFEWFANFKRNKLGNPIIALEPPQWAAATHAIVVGDTVHYYWCKRDLNRLGEDWDLRHATAPISAPTQITQNPKNPILSPGGEGFDGTAIEYPFPFLNPADGKYYMYYRGRGKDSPEQTGLLVCTGEMDTWERMTPDPVILADTDHERDGSTHTSVTIVDDVIHIVYTGKATESYDHGLTMCHAKAPTSDPAVVTKNPANPVFTGSGQEWDSWAIRETELILGPKYFHILYGGYDGQTWRVGHVRTKDFATFETNPHNPIFIPSDNPNAFDCDGILTTQIVEIGEAYYMLYAGKKGEEWQTGLAHHQTVSQ
jgi:predicted GH43/DUF377 family glycosyl hydrolase